MFYTIRFKMIGNAAAVLCFLLAAALLLRAVPALRRTETAAQADGEKTLIIDAGHGGFDGGAIAVNGVKESDINLAVARRLHALAGLYGIHTVMTRIDDSRRTDILSYSEHEDLVHRAEIINAVPNGVLISIHQNYYPTTQPFGAQVLYAADEQSRRLGRLTQSNLVSFLQPENRRLAEPASPGLYLTANVTCPAILVECGFLSNYNEMEKLMDASYQTALATVLMASFLQFLPTESLT